MSHTFLISFSYFASLLGPVGFVLLGELVWYQFHVSKHWKSIEHLDFIYCRERELEAGIIRAAAAHGKKKNLLGAAEIFLKSQWRRMFFLAHGSHCIPEIDF